MGLSHWRQLSPEALSSPGMLHETPRCLLSYQTLSYLAEKGEVLDQPLLFSLSKMPFFDMTKVSLACAARKPWVCSGCCHSWTQIPDPTRRDGAGTCALLARVFVFNLASLQTLLWGAKLSAGIHCTKQMQVSKWPNGCWKGSEHNLLPWQQKPCTLWMYLPDWWKSVKQHQSSTTFSSVGAYIASLFHEHFMTS